jgi:hypothetical protein
MVVQGLLALQNYGKHPCPEHGGKSYVSYFRDQPNAVSDPRLMGGFYFGCPAKGYGGPRQLANTKKTGKACLFQE